MRPTGKEGFLYGVEFGEPVKGSAVEGIGNDLGADTDGDDDGDDLAGATPDPVSAPKATLAKSGWYKIKAIDAENSGIPKEDPKANDGQPLEAGDVFWAEKGLKLGTGDILIPMTLDKLSFTTDVSAAAQGQAIDVTTQIDVKTGSRAYEPSAFKEQTGSINGVVDVDSPQQQKLINEFSAVINDDGEYVTRYPAKTGVHHFMISYRETKIPGETEMWRYFPIIVESFQMDKPVDGAVPFNFNYRVDGKNRPAIIYRTVK